MNVIVKKWGNSAAIRIPASVMETTHLKLNDAVDVHEENGRIIIELIKPRKYELDQLLAGITPENLHAEMSFGAPIGKEVF